MAIYPDDANMRGRRPDKEPRTTEDYLVNSVRMGQGYERVIIDSRRPYRTYSLEYNNVSDTVMNRIRNFYRARSGGFESFTFDLDHIAESGSVTVKFDGALDILPIGVGNLYSVKFSLKEVNI